MARPEFPNPYTILTPSMISRIRQEQEHYDADPEQAEREQSAWQELQEEERRREQDRDV